MASCRTVQDEMTAWIDAALPPRSAARIAEHLDRCAACAAAVARARTAIAQQRGGLSRLVAAESVAVAPLWANLRRALASEPDSVEPGWLWHGWLRPAAVAGAALAVGLIALLAVVGGPTNVLIPLGVAPPPAKIKSAPGLFKDYAIIQHLDALENFDTVEAEPLDDDQGAQHG